MIQNPFVWPQPRAAVAAGLAIACMFHAPAASAQSRPRAEQRVSTDPRATADLIVQLTSCRAAAAESGQSPSVTCELRVTSRGKDRYERVDCGSGLTRAADDQGREMTCVDARLAGEKTGGLVGQEVLLPAGQPKKLELRLLVRESPPSKVSLLRVAIADDLDWSLAEFQNVPVAPSAPADR